MGPLRHVCGSGKRKEGTDLRHSVTQIEWALWTIENRSRKKSHMDPWWSSGVCLGGEGKDTVAPHYSHQLTDAIWSTNVNDTANNNIALLCIFIIFIRYAIKNLVIFVLPF